MLVIGRTGIYREDDENGLDSNTDNLLRLASCDILLTTALHTPELDIKAEESIHWTPEAEEKIGRAPAQVPSARAAHRGLLARRQEAAGNA